MKRLRGLAWDDAPEDFMKELSRRLVPYGIDLEIQTDHGAFLAKFNPDDYDFVVIDLYDDTPQGFEAVGDRLAKAVDESVSALNRHWYPIFVVTAFLERLIPNNFDHLPPHALLRHKANPVFVASLIREDLRRRGVMIRRDKVFLVRDSRTEDARVVRDWLEDAPRKLKVETVNPGNTLEILTMITRKMSECGGIVAVCQKDEVAVGNGLFRTRPNLTLEIGMAISLPRGLDRLVIVKHKDVERPTNIAGLMTLDYDKHPSEVFADLESRLNLMGVDLSGGYEQQNAAEHPLAERRVV